MTGIRTPLSTALVTVIVLATAAGCATPPGIRVPSRAPSASPVRCGPLTCAYGHVGQRCVIAYGLPAGLRVPAGRLRGIVVEVAPGKLGCDTDGPVTPPPSVLAPAPVPSAATLSGRCVPGLQEIYPHHFYPHMLVAPSSTGYEPAYQLTLANVSAVAADVSGFTVVFYDASGTETGSDEADSVSGGFIEPGQSLTWTITSGDSNGTIPSGAASCELGQWYRP